MTPSLTVQQVADALQVAPKTVRKLAVRGELKAFRVGPQWRFFATAVAQYQARQTYVPVKVEVPAPPRPPSRPVSLRVRRRFV